MNLRCLKQSEREKEREKKEKLFKGRKEAKKSKMALTFLRCNVSLMNTETIYNCENQQIIIVHHLVFNYLKSKNWQLRQFP